MPHYCIVSQEVNQRIESVDMAKGIIYYYINLLLYQ